MTNTLKIEPTPTSVTSLTLYKEGNKFYITAYIMNTNELDIEYYDIGGPYGDYEHHLRLTEEATQKLCKIYECGLHNLLQKVYENIDWSKGTDQPFQNFCDENELKYGTFTWIED